MKRTVPFLLMITLMLLCGCSAAESAEEKALEIRAKYLQPTELTFRADMTADYGDRVYDYTVSYTGDGNCGVLSIEKPLEISGISVSYTEDGLRLMSEGAIIDTGPLWADGLSPAEAFPTLLESWRTGWITSSYRETLDGRECVVLELCLGADENRTACTWFYEETLQPAAAELFSDGVSVLRCNFIDKE